MPRSNAARRIREVSRPTHEVGSRAKTTISISRELLDYADRRAMERGATRSQVIEDLLADALRGEQDEVAAEGYAFFAKESEEFAQRAAPLLGEVLADAREEG